VTRSHGGVPPAGSPEDRGGPPAPDRVSRRAFLSGAGSLLAGLGLAACGSSGTPSPVPTSNPALTPAVPPPHTRGAPAVLRGVNSFTLAYAESDPAYPGEPQSSYDFLAARGHRIIRLPFGWGVLQPRLGGPLDPRFLAALRTEVDRIRKAGMFVILDLHSAGHWPRSDSPVKLGSGISQQAFVDVWLRLSQEFRSDRAVLAYDLANEPDVDADIWEAYSQACVNGLRKAGDRTLLWVEAVDFSAPEAFPDEHGSPWIDDPANKVMYSAHQYFDRSGQYAQGFDLAPYSDAAASAVERLSKFTDWLAEHGQRGSVGEIGWPSSRRTASWSQWNAIGQRWYEAADRAGLWVTYFSATSAYDEPQDAYDAPQNRFRPIPGISVAESQASVIEAHPSHVPGRRTSVRGR
jgi:endoglucanase